VAQSRVEAVWDLASKSHGGEKAALSKKFLAEVEKVLPSLPEVVPSNSNPSESTSIAEELKSLKDLHDQGVLSEEEFSRAKDKLLS
jgi:hypothetical protein